MHSGGTYRPEIDGLRAIAVLAVILYHADLAGFSGGFVGVDVFFVISGYLIARRLADPDASVGSFLEDRARRIVPALYAMITILITLGIVFLHPQTLKALLQESIASTLFLSNLFFFFAIDYFNEANKESFLIHIWSLSVEAQFYLLFPLLLILARRLRLVVPIFAAAFAISLFLCIAWSFEPGGAAFYLPQARLWQFLAGAMCLAVERRSVIGGNSWLAAAGLFLIMAPVFLFKTGYAYPGYLAIMPVAGTALFLCFARGNSLVARIASVRPLVGIGIVSYSAYLYHQPIFAFARLRLTSDPEPQIMLLLGALSFIPAYISWRFIELPFRRRGKLHATTTHFVAGTTLAATCIVAAGLGAASFADSMRFRYDPEQLKIVDLDRKAAQRYVRAAFNEKRLVPFPANGRKNVFIIGDSYAQDLVNALTEAGLVSRVNISTHHIGKDCGNLFLTRDFSELIAQAWRNRCRGNRRYDDPRVVSNLEKADVVLLASSWLSWQIPLLKESIDNIRQSSSADVLLFGIKHLGNVRPAAFVDLSLEEKRSRPADVAPKTFQVNERIHKAVGDYFFNMQDIICGGDRNCPLFTDDGFLISFDGAHLTKNGAQFVGAKLALDARIAAIFR
jgi:peptidoglycan/LPS O-acetylase OafA/YrhL